MAGLQDQAVRDLLRARNHAIVSTFGDDGSIHSAVAWIDLEDGELAVNSAEGRRWPTNLERDPRITVLVRAEGDPNEYVEIRGTTRADRAEADDHIDRLTKKFIDQDTYPFRQPGEVRIKFVIDPERVRYQKQ